MSLRHRLALLALLAGLQASAGCAEPVAPARLPTVDAVASASALRAGEPLSVTVTATNATAAALDVFDPFGWLEIRDATGRIVASGRFRLENMPLLPPRHLATGESATEVYAWAGQRTDGAGILVPAGRYELRAVVHVYGSAGGVAYSDPITVTVSR